MKDKGAVLQLSFQISKLAVRKMFQFHVRTFRSPFLYFPSVVLKSTTKFPENGSQFHFR